MSTNDLLAAANVQALERAAGRTLLVAFDYDGTLAPIVDRPEAADMRPRTRVLLAEVARRYPTIVLSGRAQEDVAERLRGIAVKEVLGNYGAARAPAAGADPARVRGWRDALERELAGQPGVLVEDKGVALAVHYRQAPDEEGAREAILDVAYALPGARVIGGKLVGNVVPEGAPAKGVARVAARARAGCDAALYVGDDASDEEVFRLVDEDWLLAVRVGADPRTLAPYTLRDQAAVDELLERLVALRPSY